MKNIRNTLCFTLLLALKTAGLQVIALSKKHSNLAGQLVAGLSAAIQRGGHTAILLYLLI